MAAVVDALAQGIDKLSVKDGALPPPPNGREVVIGIDLGELCTRALWPTGAWICCALHTLQRSDLQCVACCRLLHRNHLQLCGSLGPRHQQACCAALSHWREDCAQLRCVHTTGASGWPGQCLHSRYACSCYCDIAKTKFLTLDKRFLALCFTQPAKSQAPSNPANTVYDVKRIIGRR
jgi:hypothetical protein